MSALQLWNLLSNNQMVSGDKPENDHVLIPWYIRFIQGFAGWLAAIFIMVFFAVFFSFLFKKPAGGLVVALGLLCSVAGYVIIRVKQNDFIDQLGMAFSLCGQLLFSFGIFFFLKINTTTGAFILGTYQLTLAWLIPQYAHRLLSTAFGLFALLVVVNSMGYYGIGTALTAVLFSLIWIKEKHWAENYQKWEPIGLGIAFTIIFSSSFLITGKHLLRETYRHNTGWLFEHAELVSSLLVSLVFLNLIFTLLKEYKTQLNSKTAILSFLAATGLILISFKIYGISTGLLIVLVGFARHRILLITLGIMSMLSFFSWYYYNLQATLLFKSIVLVVLGLILLVAWFGLNYIYKNKHAQQSKKFKLKSINKNKWLGLTTILATLVIININISKKEALIETGEVLLLKLAPVDPRSIMQGDYMRLRFDLANKIATVIRENNKNNTLPIYLQGRAIIAKDSNNIVSFVALFEDQTLKPSQRLMPYKYRNGQVKFTTNAFFFQEGQASHFQQSEYGEFKMSKDGDILLVNMVDKDLNIL